MATQKKQVDTQQLVADWAALTITLQTRSLLDYQQFKDIYTKTFEILKKCRESKVIDKKLMYLVINVNNFIGTPNTSVDFLPKAAFVLTERMLSYCVQEEGGKNDSTQIRIYLTEGFKELILDLAKVDESIDTLTQFFQRTYMNTLGH